MVETKSQKAMRSGNLPKNIMDKIEKGGGGLPPLPPTYRVKRCQGHMVILGLF